MNRIRTSIIWTISKNKLQEIINKAPGLNRVLEKLGISKYSAGSFLVLKQRISQDNLSLEQMNLNKLKSQKERNFKRRMNNEEVFCEDSDYSRNNLKGRIIENNYITYECSKCKNKGEWGGIKLSLQLNHKNGINNDNRLENLEFLCPNCHSQTENYAGKSRKRIYICSCCKKEYPGYGKLCSACVGLKQRKFEASRGELEKLVKSYPFTQIGKMFGVNDNSIRKRCIKLGVEIPNFGRGYWSKNKDKGI